MASRIEKSWVAAEDEVAMCSKQRRPECEMPATFRTVVLFWEAVKSSGGGWLEEVAEGWQGHLEFL